MWLSMCRLFVVMIAWLMIGAAHALTLKPPVLPDETYFPTNNGCGIVEKTSITPDAKAETEKRARYLAKLLWFGRCQDGFADGLGALMSPEEATKNGFLSNNRNEYVLGRKNNSITGSVVNIDEITYRQGDKYVSIPVGTDPYKAYWTEEIWVATRFRDQDGNYASTDISPCIIAPKKIRGCNTHGNAFNVYSVQLRKNNEENYVYLLCPNPIDATTCEAFWQEKAGPVLGRIKGFVAEVEESIASERATYAALITPAWKQQAERNYQAQLDTGSAQQLYELVSSLSGGRQLAQASQVNQVLANRFPESPLIAKATGKLTTAICEENDINVPRSESDARVLKYLYQNPPCAQSEKAQEKIAVADEVINRYEVINRQRAETDAFWAAHRAKQQQDIVNGLAQLQTIVGIYANASANRAAEAESARQAQIQQQQEQLQIQARQSAPPASPAPTESDRSKEIAADGRFATDCVRLEVVAANDSRVSGMGGRILVNGCEDVVEVAWCYVDEDCNRSGNVWSIQPGYSWPVSATKEIRWGACHGANTIRMEEGSAGLRYICHAPS